MNLVLLRYELLGLMRDTRTLVLSVLLPIVLLPVLLFTLHRLSQQRLHDVNEIFHFGREGSSDGFDSLTKSVFGNSPFRELLTEHSDQMLADGSIDLMLKIGLPDTSNQKLATQVKSTFPALGRLSTAELSGRPVIEILYRGDRDRSVQAFIKARERFAEYREDLLRDYLNKEKAAIGIELESRDVSSDQERAARRYGPALSSFMVLILLGGGSVAALDSLAGEKERGTLTTLFLSSLPRSEIIWSKFCVVALISILVAFVQVANLGVYALFGWIDLPVRLSPGQGLAVLVCLAILFLAEALFTASVLLHISARSGSFKEAQLFFFPIFLVSFALSLSGMLPGLPSRSILSLIPLAGPGLLIPEILAFRIDIPTLLLQVVVHAAAAFWLLRSTLTFVSREEFLAGQPPAVGRALLFDRFSQRALPFYALLAAAMMVVPSNFGWLSTLPGQTVFNQVLLFGLGPLLLLRFYRQSLRQAVPLRSVSLPILLACLALIPLGQVAATGLSHLVGPWLPAPVKAMEEMMSLLDLGNTPLWQTYLMIGIMPALCEEFAFRGVLLHSLHRRFSPLGLAAVVALVFGLFHLSYYRVIPTAYLGFVLGLLTLATGSLWPAVIIHLGNNSLAVFALSNSLDIDGLGSLTYITSFIGQWVLIALVVRWGRGYPGTRWERSSAAKAFVD